MTWFEDLSPCTFLGRECGQSVGWLDAEKPFSTGEVPAEFLLRLAALHREHQSLKTRGFHQCPFCSASDDARHLHRSNAEIAVRARDGTIYRAPALILHYVAAHGYRPPDQFISAVVNGEPLKLS